MTQIHTEKRWDPCIDVVGTYALMHLACFGVLWTGVTRTGLAVFAGSFVLRMFGLGVGYHRYFAHRAFKTSRAMQFVLALVGVLSMQRGPLWWAQTHRDHHRAADTPDDIHSPRYHGFLYSYSGWFSDRRHHTTDLARVGDLAAFPELVWLDDSRVYAVPMLLYALALYTAFGGEGLLWGIAVSTVMLWHVTHWIQSFSHSAGGYRRFESRDNSRNHWLVGVVSLGEYHNNHHAAPSSAMQGVVWWEIDVGYLVVRAMSAVGLVWDVRTHPGRGK